MQIKALYFAQLADLAGKSEELHEITEPSPAALYTQVKALYNFPQSYDQIQVAINHQLSAHQSTLKEGDTIAFLPPMTGG